jgi:hypothetical protein
VTGITSIPLRGSASKYYSHMKQFKILTSVALLSLVLASCDSEPTGPSDEKKPSSSGQPSSSSVEAGSSSSLDLSSSSEEATSMLGVWYNDSIAYDTTTANRVYVDWPKTTHVMIITTDSLKYYSLSKFSPLAFSTPSALQAFLDSDTSVYSKRLMAYDGVSTSLNWNVSNYYQLGNQSDFINQGDYPFTLSAQGGFVYLTEDYLYVENGTKRPAIKKFYPVSGN